MLNQPNSSDTIAKKKLTMSMPPCGFYGIESAKKSANGTRFKLLEQIKNLKSGYMCFVKDLKTYGVKNRT